LNLRNPNFSSVEYKLHEIKMQFDKDIKKLKIFLELSIEITYKKRTYDARLGEISGDSYGKSYSIS